MPGVEESLFLLLASLLITILRYFVLSGGMYWFFNKRGNPLRPRWIRAVTPVVPSRSQLTREIKWGLWSCLVLGVIGWLATMAVLAGETQVYLSLGERSIIYGIFSFLILTFVHDAYFFWTHYLLHVSPRIYRRIHAVHHSSRHPSPFADLSFHPVEAAVQGAFVPLMLFVLPLHPVVIFSYLFFVSLMNAIGHTGFEMFPDSTKTRPVLRYLSSPGNHAQHHLNPRLHLGLYLDVWDRLMGSHSRH